jgi:hypothetical protein
MTINRSWIGGVLRLASTNKAFIRQSPTGVVVKLTAVVVGIHRLFKMSSLSSAIFPQMIMLTHLSTSL